MQKLARAWAELDADSAVACFAHDAIYMQPADVQLYTGASSCVPTSAP